MEKILDYKTTKAYDLVIKVEDKAPAGLRRSVNVTFNVEVAFVPTQSSDPEVKTELELTFPNVDYDAVILGNEASFIAALNATLTLQNPGVIFVHFTLRRGSVIATFDMITTESTQNEALNRIASDVNSDNGFTVDFNGVALKSNSIKVENQTYVPSVAIQDGNSSMVSWSF